MATAAAIGDTAARRIFMAGVAAADPSGAVRAALNTHRAAWADIANVHVLAAGKAAVPMIRAALETAPAGQVRTAIAVTNYENVETVAGAEVMGAAHPLPDEAGARAAEALEAAAGRAGEGDVVLCLISGGASALLPAPVDGVSLAEKIAATDLLLRSGADIVEMNTVRKALSRLKGGGLARAIAPARGLALILSDVPGDDPSVIASGPTAPDPMPPDEALAIVTRYGIAGALPASVRAHLEARASTAPDASESTTTNHVVGSNAISVAAATREAAALGFATFTLPGWLDGDVGDAAALLHVTALTVDGDRPTAILAGGETSVHVTGTGKGGRNQELALRFAVLCAERPLPRAWVFLSGGTDGRDGPTDAAGAIVAPGTLDAIAAAGVSVEDALADNDAYRALQAADALLTTGATGTNVADLQVLLI